MTTADNTPLGRVNRKPLTALQLASKLNRPWNLSTIALNKVFRRFAFEIGAVLIYRKDPESKLGQKVILYSIGTQSDEPLPEEKFKELEAAIRKSTTLEEAEFKYETSHRLTHFVFATSGVKMEGGADYDRVDYAFAMTYYELFSRLKARAEDRGLRLTVSTQRPNGGTAEKVFSFSAPRGQQFAMTPAQVRSVRQTHSWIEEQGFRNVRVKYIKRTSDSAHSIIQIRMSIALNPVFADEKENKLSYRRPLSRTASFFKTGILGVQDGLKVVCPNDEKKPTVAQAKAALAGEHVWERPKLPKAVKTKKPVKAKADKKSFVVPNIQGAGTVITYWAPMKKMEIKAVVTRVYRHWGNGEMQYDVVQRDDKGRQVTRSTKQSMLRSVIGHVLDLL